jgi:AcrR family transcriptional regulator
MTSKLEQVRARPRRTATPATRTGRRRASGGAAEAATPYHHGALRDALLVAAERVLERDGLAGLTLRAVARDAGVSHAAPTHHFKDLTGLVSELAAIGFTRFNVTMKAAGEQPGTPVERAMARARAYVAYAQANPGMYGLMFRTERLDYSRPSLHHAAEASFAGLAGSVAPGSAEQPAGEPQLSLDQAAAIARAWSLVHGYTMLLLDGRLADILRRSPPGTTAESLLEAMLRATVPRLPPGT